MTLDELKLKNAEEEAANEQAPQPDLKAVDTVAVDVEEQVSGNDLAEDQAEESDNTEIEPWMQTELPGSENNSERMFTGSDVAAAKSKIRAKVERKKNAEIEERDAEIEKLKAKLANFEPSNASAPRSNKLKRPRPENFDNDEAYESALDAYEDARIEARLADNQMQNAEASKVREFRSRIEKGVDSHYELAVQFTQEAGINQDVYKQADANVRNAIEDALGQGRGDEVANLLISKLGKGSEKLVFFLGRNESKLNELKAMLTGDPSGIDASIWLGRKQNELLASNKIKTKTPAPPTNIGGDVETGDLAAKLKSEYRKAEKSGDVQARFDARMKATRAGVDVEKW
tara:strand:+ start:7243 stop:8277 length:1035 start_codon:yes stop_codon:yes gene_type:complete